jgi:hypothetical protein
VLTRLILAIAAVTPLIGYAVGAAWSMHDPSIALNMVGHVRPSLPAHLLRLRAETVEAVDVPGGRMCRVAARVVEVVRSEGTRSVAPGEAIAFQTLCRWDARRIIPLLTYEDLRGGNVLEAGFVESGRDRQLVLRPMSLRLLGT